MNQPSCRKTALRLLLVRALCVALLSLALPAQAQVAALKTNILYDATTTPNLGLEFYAGGRSTVQVFYGLNPWHFADNKQLRHWSLMPEWRLWLGNERMKGHFLGLHGLVAQYNMGGVGPISKLRHNRYEGWLYGGGLTYGYAWRLGQHWNLEAAIGVGYTYVDYERYQNVECGRLLRAGHHHYVGPTKLALNVAYLFGVRKPRPAEPAVVPVVVEPEPQPHTPYQPDYRLAFYTPAVEAQKVRNLSGKAFLDFPVNQTVIRPEYRANQRELDSVIHTIDAVRTDPNTRITHIAIHGYASPEGSYANNQRLAQGRAAAFKDYVRALIQLPDSVFDVQSTPEDWDGLVRHLADSAAHYPIADDVRRLVADTQLTPDQREARMRQQWPQLYQRILRNIYPALRHSDYTVSYVVRPFTVEETRQLIATKPQQLSLSEMYLLAREYKPGTLEYNDVFMTAVRMFPTDEGANLNAAIIALQAGDLEQAGRYLQRAGNTPEAQNARGILLARQGRLAEALQLLQATAIPEAQHNASEIQKLLTE